MKRELEETLQNASNENAKQKQKGLEEQNLQNASNGKDNLKQKDNHMMYVQEKHTKLSSMVLEQRENDMMHVKEEHTKLITQMKQDHSEQLKSLREKTITMSKEVETVFKELRLRLEVYGQKLEEELLPFE